VDSQLVELALIDGEDHCTEVLEAVRGAKRSVWIATANLKELMVEVPALGRRRRFRSILEELNELAERGVELRILHATIPSRAFRERFDDQEALVGGGLELRRCERVHLKVVVVDGALLYLGSANWTGAGMGAKHRDRRNFELGILTRDDAMLDTIQARFDALWRGTECARCRLRDECEMPLDVLQRCG